MPQQKRGNKFQASYVLTLAHYIAQHAFYRGQGANIHHIVKAFYSPSDFPKYFFL